MEEKKIDLKETVEETELVKEETDPKRDYIFKKSGITKTGFWIIIAFLIMIILGLILSGVLFSDPDSNL